MSWQDDLKKIEDVFHQKLRTDATFEWLYVRAIDEANQSDRASHELIDGMTQLGKHVALHAQYPIAKKLFEKTLELCEKKLGYEDIRSGKLCDSIANCLMMQGKYNEGLATLEKWVLASDATVNKSDPDHREIIAHYAELIYRSGKNAQAKEVVQKLLQILPEKDPLTNTLNEKLVRYDTPWQTSFDPADHEQAQLLREETLHGSPASLESLRQAVFDIVVKQAVAGAPWKDLCRGPLEINGITEAEIEAEVGRRKALAQSSRTE
jgi:tetratricopeptide (TPR) repeat protein